VVDSLDGGHGLNAVVLFGVGLEEFVTWALVAVVIG
jgi:hypothetical protein